MKTYKTQLSTSANGNKALIVTHDNGKGLFSIRLNQSDFYNVAAFDAAIEEKEKALECLGFTRKEG